MASTPRARALTQRFERGEGKDRSFWEITRSKATITTRFGRYLSAGRRIEKQLADADEAERTAARLIAEKRKEGYAEPMQRVEPGAASTKGVSVRNAELESTIDAAPHDPEGYLVYADWLQQQGDPRGELIVVQHGRSLDPHDVALERTETALMKKFETELLGPLARYRFIRTPQRSYQGFAWRSGFIRAARLKRIAETTLSEVVAMVLAHPSARFIERLVLGRTSYGASDERLSAVLKVLGALAPRTLDTVIVGDSFESGVDISSLWSAMPRLRSLVVSGANAYFGTVRADALEELLLTDAGHDQLDVLARAQWPNLKTLSLTLTMPTASVLAALDPLFASDGLPSLEQLSVRRWMTRAADPERIAPQDPLALDTLAYAGRRGLRRLELEMPMTDDGCRRLLSSAHSLAAIGAITIPKDAISSGMRTSLSRALPNIAWTDGPLEHSPGDLELLGA